MNDLKLQIRDEDELENEIKILRAIGKDINTDLVLKNCANIWQQCGIYNNLCVNSWGYAVMR